MKIANAFTINDPRIEPEPNTGCWLWARALRPDGYARTTQQIADGRKGVYVHRAAWETVNGPIPVGMMVDHICRVRSCCNPDHLRVVTPRINAIENSIGFAARHAAKLACGRCGGPLVYVERVRQRLCPACQRRINAAVKRRARLKLKAYAAEQERAK